jgi:hypothetical protein
MQVERLGDERIGQGRAFGPADYVLNADLSRQAPAAAMTGG